KGYIIKEYFSNYNLHVSDLTFDLSSGKVDIHQSNSEPWRVTLVDTGENTMTGGRLKRVMDFVSDEDFCFTYGDGVGDINITELVELHKREGRIATVTATQPPGRFGALEIEGSKVKSFLEKPPGDRVWINGGFFVLSPKVGDYIGGDDVVWEKGPMETIAREGQLSAYIHEGYWQPMDTLRDKNGLEELWASGKAPWKIWG
ncbi:MAG: glucose-1-phosphate cytidylyltransferase, partial [Rhodospirillaceae bacterium]|nr:glucose-1-phosphate cytidylyltransferase [Rhodospirillaceae bacterium]